VILGKNRHSGHNFGHSDNIFRLAPIGFNWTVQWGLFVGIGFALMNL